MVVYKERRNEPLSYRTHTAGAVAVFSCFCVLCTFANSLFGPLPLTFPPPPPAQTSSDARQGLSTHPAPNQRSSLVSRLCGNGIKCVFLNSISAVLLAPTPMIAYLSLLPPRCFLPIHILHSFHHPSTTHRRSSQLIRVSGVWFGVPM